MKISSINSFSSSKVQGFGHTAVPYPEYQGKSPSFSHTAVPYPEYIGYKKGDDGIISVIMDTMAGIFHPQVQKEADAIKSSIDSIYDNSSETGSASKQLLSVLA